VLALALVMCYVSVCGSTPERRLYIAELLQYKAGAPIAWSSSLFQQINFISRKSTKRGEITAPRAFFFLAADFFFEIGRAKKKKARGAVISPRLVDLREIKIYLLKQRGTPGESS